MKRIYGSFYFRSLSVSIVAPNQQKKINCTIKYYGISLVNHLNLNFTKNPSLTWSPPSFYSDDIPQGSITTYHIIVNMVL